MDALAALEGAEAGSDYFAGHPELRNGRTVELLHDEVLRTLYADLNRAGRLARAADALARELDEPVSRAASFRALGHISYAASRYEEAIGYYGEALQILEALGRDQDAGRTLMSGLQSLSYLGRYEEANAWAARAKEIFQRLGDPLRLARLASNVGNILYRQDRYEAALAKYQEAQATLASIGEPRDVAAVLSNIAVCQISLGSFPEALESYRQARAYCERHGLALLVAEADYNIAYLHYLRGDFLRAIELYKASRRHYRAAGDSYHTALCDLDEAEIYLELNLNTDSAEMAQQAEAGFETLAMPYERGKAMVTRAIAASRRGDRRSAIRLFRQARELFTGEQNALWRGLIDLYHAMLLERDGADRAAGRLCRRAYRRLSQSVLPGRAALAELLEARLLLKSRCLPQAGEAVLRALARLEGAATPWLRFHARFLQGQIEEEGGDEAGAYAAYQSASGEIESLRSQLWADEARISFLKDKSAVYENLVNAVVRGKAAQGGAAEEAFRHIQQAKSRSLAELMSISDRAVPGRTPSGADSAIEEVRRVLNANYRHIEHLAASGSTGARAQMETVRRSVSEYEVRLQRLVAAAATSGDTPRTFAVDLPALEAIQASIPSGASLLEYYVARDVLYVCLLDGSSLEIVPLGGMDGIRTRSRLLRFQIARFRRGRDDSREETAPDHVADEHLRELYSDLIAPVRNRLNDRSHLIIAPNDSLHNLPFHALRGPGGPLIDEFTVSYAPSATVHALCAGRPRRFGAESLVLGLPDRLAPSIEEEARTAAAMLPGARLFLGADATEAVLREHGTASRFIHIAAHGLYRRDNPLFSAIRLGDTRLTLLDLYRLPLSAELVTLSGCSTGLNSVVGGDELLGLMRGVLLAGAHSVMVSLWDVNDVSTARFMQLFYGELQRTDNKAAAMRAAIQEIRRQFPGLYHWAPFVLAGNVQGGGLQSSTTMK